MLGERLNSSVFYCHTRSWQIIRHHTYLLRTCRRTGRLIKSRFNDNFIYIKLLEISLSLNQVQTSVATFDFIWFWEIVMYFRNDHRIKYYQRRIHPRVSARRSFQLIPNLILASVNEDLFLSSPFQKGLGNRALGFGIEWWENKNIASLWRNFCPSLLPNLVEATHSSLEWSYLHETGFDIIESCSARKCGGGTNVGVCWSSHIRTV